MLSTDNRVTTSSRLRNPNASTDIESTESNTSGTARFGYLNSDLSALSIRATEYLQRWKEVVQFSSKDYSDQMAAQFGIKAPEYMGNHANYPKDYFMGMLPSSQYGPVAVLPSSFPSHDTAESVSWGA